MRIILIVSIMTLAGCSAGGTFQSNSSSQAELTTPTPAGGSPVTTPPVVTPPVVAPPTSAVPSLLPAYFPQPKPTVLPAIPASAIAVANQTELDSALSKLVGGETIVLEDGTYSKLTLTNRVFAAQVFIRARQLHKAVFEWVAVTGSENVRIYGLSVQPRFGTSGFSTGAAVRVSGKNLLYEDSAISFSSDISKFTAADWVAKIGNGISMGGDNIRVRNNVLTNVAFGISGSAKNSFIQNNQITNFRGDGIRSLGDYTAVEYNIIKNCYNVDDNHDDGFQSWSVGADGKVGTGQVVGGILRGNVIINQEDPAQQLSGPLQGIGMFDGTFVDWVIENNLVVVNHWHGISLYGVKNSRVVNNTVVSLDGSTVGPPWIKLTAHKDGTLPTGNLVKNNLTTDLASSASGVTLETNVVVKDPKTYFRDTTKFDYRLKVGASAHDAGTQPNSPIIDILGVARMNGPVDVGAYDGAN